ncbi:MAG: S8 family serine peptidase [Anaerolineales bacterium]|nr:S8 family serine peptidase [Anaerolineales bacterium]
MENHKNNVVSEPDDWRAIDGIGATIAQALPKIGLSQYADMAATTPEELSQHLRDQANIAISPKTIRNKDWIGQAKNLAKEANRQAAVSQLGSGKWVEHAYFTLKFEYTLGEAGQQVWRIWIYREQDGGAEVIVPNVMEPAGWVNWIMAHANLPFAWQPLQPQTERVMEMVAGVEAVPEIEAMATSESSVIKTTDAITLMRGGEKLTFKKVPDTFAVRLKEGQATNERMLNAVVGEVAAAVKHVDTKPLEQMDLFQMETASELETTMDKMRQAPATDVVTHVYTLDATPSAAVIPTGTITIQFKPDVAKEKKETLLAEFGLDIVEALDFIPGGYTVSLTDASRENPLKIATKLQDHPEVELAEPDLSVPPAYSYKPVDSLYVQQWHLNNMGNDTGLKAGADVKAEAAWDITRGDRKITICIIDDGFDLSHPEFNLPDKIVAGRDFGENDFDPTPVFSGNNHGTACAGVALAEENGEGVVGLAPRCSLMPLRWGDLSDNAVVAYFQYAIDHGADVISCSWSARPWNFPLSAKMKGIIHKAATQGRGGKGCVILFAAGNEERPLNGSKNGRISHQGFALHPDVIAVAASNSLDQHASYSNYGPEVALCAPSCGSPGWRIVTTDRLGTQGYKSGDYTFSFGGTSSATPLAAGLAALILSKNNQLTSAEVKQIMMETADKIGEEHGQYVNGHSPLFGHGRINAQRALQRVAELMNEEPPADKQPPPPVKLTVETAVSTVRIREVTGSTPLGDKQLQTAVSFVLTGDDAPAAANSQLPYRVDVAIFMPNNEQSPASAGFIEGVLKPQQLGYSHQILSPMLPTGSYSLQIQIKLTQPSGTESTQTNQYKLTI